ncbi:putative diguanylate cyclase YdaM [Thalassocella blandensis]|nr:putative diguanylate cyclase YdaM [Thalassocella blandensis]
MHQPHVQLDIEFVDAKRFPEQENIDHFFLSLGEKLRGMPPYDLLIVGDDIAVEQVLQRKDGMFAGMPMVFFGINNLALLRALEAQQITGVVEAVSLVETMRFAHHLFPAQPLVFISDATVTGKSDLDKFLPEAEKLSIPYEVVSLAEFSFEELPAKLQHYDSNTPILLIAAYFDKNAKKKDFYESLSIVLGSANGPVFHLWEHGFGYGLFGGKIISHYQQGKVAARKAMEILHNDSSRSIPIEYVSPNSWVFDYEVMQRFSIAASDLPAGSTLINRPSNQQPFKTIIYAIIGLLILASIVQLYILKRRRKEQLKIKRLNEKLERTVAERTRDLEKTKEQVENSLRARDLILDNSIVAIVLVVQNQISWCNSYCEYLFGYSEQELRDIPIDELMQEGIEFATVSAEVEEQIKNNGVYVDEVHFKRKTGEYFWGLVNAKSVSHDTFREGILFIVSDISKIKTIQIELEMLNEKLIHISQTDELTQVANRRSINEILAREQNRLVRYQQSYCVILLDVDHFKAINDNFGHSEGDEVLKKIARLLIEELRSVDEVGRWGGEEFMIVCPFTLADQALHIANMLREIIKLNIHVDGKAVTASFGVYQPSSNDSVTNVLEEVDKALYKAKETRDAVAISPTLILD